MSNGSGPHTPFDKSHRDSRGNIHIDWTKTSDNHVPMQEGYIYSDYEVPKFES